MTAARRALDAQRPSGLLGLPLQGGRVPQEVHLARGLRDLSGLGVTRVILPEPGLRGWLVPKLVVERKRPVAFEPLGLASQRQVVCVPLSATPQELHEELTERFGLTCGFRLLATSREATVRDGARALELAEALFEAAQSVETAETMALALAASGYGVALARAGRHEAARNFLKSSWRHLG